MQASLTDYSRIAEAFAQAEVALAKALQATEPPYNIETDPDGYRSYLESAFQTAKTSARDLLDGGLSEDDAERLRRGLADIINSHRRCLRQVQDGRASYATRLNSYQQAQQHREEKRRRNEKAEADRKADEQRRRKERAEREAQEREQEFQRQAEHKAREARESQAREQQAREQAERTAREERERRGNLNPWPGEGERVRSEHGRSQSGERQTLLAAADVDEIFTFRVSAAAYFRGARNQLALELGAVFGTAAVSYLLLTLGRARIIIFFWWIICELLALSVRKVELRDLYPTKQEAQETSRAKATINDQDNIISEQIRQAEVSNLRRRADGGFDERNPRATIVNAALGAARAARKSAMERRESLERVIKGRIDRWLNRKALVSGARAAMAAFSVWTEVILVTMDMASVSSSFMHVMVFMGNLAAFLILYAISKGRRNLLSAQ